MKPILVSYHFPEGPEDRYARLARVLAYTAEKHCAQTWDVRISVVQPEVLPKHRTASTSHLANTQKMDAWYQAVMEAPDGAQLLLIDADTFIVRSLDALWDHAFDLAITTKPGCIVPFNSGVLGVRVNARSRAFVTHWRSINRRMLNDETFHQTWRRRRADGTHYGGINQAALGYMLNHRPDDGACQIAELPCREWNCEDWSWASFDPELTRIVHVKSHLRKAVMGLLGNQPMRPEVKPLVKLWHQLEAEAAKEAAA